MIRSAPEDRRGTGPSDKGEAPRPAAAVPGPVLFARYAYPPNSLGYCGPGDPSALLGAAAEGTDVAGLAHLAARFDGAWPYLQLLAAVAAALRTLSTGASSRPTGWATICWLGCRRRPWPTRSVTASSGGRGGGSNHWCPPFPPAASRSTVSMSSPSTRGLDCCERAWTAHRWRSSTAAESGGDGSRKWPGDLVAVTSRALTFDGSRLVLGPDRVEQARRSLAGVGFSGDLRPGDMVSLHWDWVCDRLSPAALRWLCYCTKRNLDAVNSLASPGPAAVCGA